VPDSGGIPSSSRSTCSTAIDKRDARAIKVVFEP
jgi:hypothetical protein